MEPRVNCEVSESIGQPLTLVNGTLSEMSVSPQIKGVFVRDDTGACQKDAVLNPPIPAQHREVDQSASPFPTQNGLLLNQDLASRENIDANMPTLTDQHSFDSNSSLKHLATSDLSAQHQNPNQNAIQTCDLDDTNKESVTGDTGAVSQSALSDTASGRPENLALTGCETQSASPTDPRGSDRPESGVTSQSQRPESEMKSFHSYNPHCAIDNETAQACLRVAGEEIKPKIQPSGDATPTASNLADAKLDVEMMGDTPAALGDDGRSEDTWPSQFLSASRHIAVGDSPSQSGDNSQANSPGVLSVGSDPPLTPSTPHPAVSSSSQKTPSKARGNTMIFIPDLSEELLPGYRILTEICGDKCKSFVWPFLDPVDTESLWDYEMKVKTPMWLRKIESKFVDKEYQSITEFAVDMRQMLENCYRYNGMKHQISKYAQTLECVFEQKLALLSRPLQEKTTLYVTSEGKYKDGCPNTIELSSGRLRRSCTRLAARAMEQASATPLAFHIRRELDQLEREEKRQKIVDRRDEIIKERQDLLEWDKQMIGDKNWTYMKSLWEIPAIGHYLCLCQSILELDEISFFELERSFAIPMESMILRRIFTTLLSTPYQRTRLGKKPPMPYKVWEARLREWVRGWYHVLDKLMDPLKVYEKIGVPERFFEVLGANFPLDTVQYHELTYYERVWVMKALCDQLFETQLPVRRSVLSQPIEDQRPIILGVDGEANSYIHFPQFCGADLRVYRQAKYPDLSRKTKKDKQVKEEECEGVDVKDDVPLRKKRTSPVTRKKTAKAKLIPMETPRARPSRLRQKLTPTLHFGTYPESLVSGTESEDATSEFTEVEEEREESDCPSELSRTVDKLRESPETIQEEQGEIRESSEKQVARQIGDDKLQQAIMTREEEPNSSITTGEEKYKLSNSTIGEKDLPTEVAEARDLKQLTKKNLDSIEQENICNEIDVKTDQLCNGDTSSQSSSNSETRCTEVLPKSSLVVPKTDQAGEDAGASMQPPVDNGTCLQSMECSTSQGHPTESEGGSEARSPDGIAVSETRNTNNNSSQAAAASCDIEPSIPPDGKHGDTVPTEGETPPSPPLKPHVEVLPVLGEFELVCDSMDTLRELVDKFGPPESKPTPPAPGRRRKAAAQVKQPLRKRCEKDLHEKLTNLLLELTPWEAKLAKFATRNREKFKKEYEGAKLVPETDQDIKDIWASEESSSESESSESESDDEDTEEDQDGEWNSGTDGRRLRKRSKKQLASFNEDDAEEDVEPVDEDTSDAPRKPKRPRPSSRSQRKSPPHKNQLNTSLLQLIKKLTEDGLKDASKRLQTMIKRGEATRNQKYRKSKGSSTSISGCGDGQAVTALLNKTFWVAAKPPAVEGIIAQSIEELITTYPTFVLNLIFRNLKNGLSKISAAEKRAQTDMDDETNERNESHEMPAAKIEPSEEASTPATADADDKSETSNTSVKIETRYSIANTPKEVVQKLGSASKPKEVMDDCILQGLYMALTLTKKILRERLAIGLSELLPDYSNLQKSALKKDPVLAVQEDTAKSRAVPSKNETDKDLVLKMLPKPSQYLNNPKMTSDLSSGLIYSSSMSSGSSATRPANSILVSVPTSKLPSTPKSNIKAEPIKNTNTAQKLPQVHTHLTGSRAGNSQQAGSTGSVPHGVYTIKVDANVWSQLQGKPELQQQFVLQQIKEMQQKQTETGPRSALTEGGVNSPAEAVTCIRSPTKGPVAAQKPSAPSATSSTPGKTASRLTQYKNMPNVADPSSLQPVKVLKQTRPKSMKKTRAGYGEATSNLTQKELIALLQQQQRQLELHRQQQQQKLLLKEIEAGEKNPQKLQAPQPEPQPYILSASGALGSPTRPQQVPGVQLPKAAGILNVGGAPLVQQLSLPTSRSVLNSSVPRSVTSLLAAQPTRLSTKTLVTASLTEPKMAANAVNVESKPGRVTMLPSTIHTSAGDITPTSVSQTAVSCKPPSATTSTPNSLGTRLHLVQTSKGSQFLLQTGSGQSPKLVSLTSSGNAVNPGSTLPVMLAGQNAQFVKHLNQPATVPVSSVTDPGSIPANQQTIRFVMQPHQTVTNDAALNLQQGLLQLGQAVQLQQVVGSGNQPPGQAAKPPCITDAVKSTKQLEMHIKQQVPSRANVAAATQNVGLRIAQTNQTPPKLSPSQFVQLPRQANPAVVLKPQVAILRGQGDAKVVVGSPANVVRLVHPSQFSTVASFIPTLDQGQVERSAGVANKTLPVTAQPLQVVNRPSVSQQLVSLPIQPGNMGSVANKTLPVTSQPLQVVNRPSVNQQLVSLPIQPGNMGSVANKTLPVTSQPLQVVNRPSVNQQLVSLPIQPGNMGSVANKTLPVTSQPLQVVNRPSVNQQLVSLPIQPGKMGSVATAQISAPVTQVSASVSGNNIQEHLQQVILQQLASGKLKLSPQAAPAPNLVPSASQQQAPVRQLSAGNLLKTLPVVLSQQIPQVVAQMPQSMPSTILTNPVATVKGGPLIHQSQNNILQSVQIFNPPQAVQTPAIRLLGAHNTSSLAYTAGQGHQLVVPACSDVGPVNSALQVPAVMVSPTRVIVPASHLVPGQQVASKSTLNQGLMNKVITKATPEGASSQQVLPSQPIILKGVKRPSSVPCGDTAAKLPRHTAPDQVPATPAVGVPSLSGLNAETSQGNN